MLLTHHIAVFHFSPACECGEDCLKAVAKPLPCVGIHGKKAVLTLFIIPVYACRANETALNHFPFALFAIAVTLEYHELRL